MEGKGSLETPGKPVSMSGWARRAPRSRIIRVAMADSCISLPSWPFYLDREACPAL